jgi:hypothetical protein
LYYRNTQYIKVPTFFFFGPAEKSGGTAHFDYGSGPRAELQETAGYFRASVAKRIRNRLPCGVMHLYVEPFMSPDLGTSLAKSTEASQVDITQSLKEELMLQP